MCAHARMHEHVYLHLCVGMFLRVQVLGEQSHWLPLTWSYRWLRGIRALGTNESAVRAK